MSVKLEINNKNIRAKIATKATVPRMRTIKESITEIKLLDPETSITEHGLRLLSKDPYIIEQGIVKFVGSRALFNIDRLIDYYAS